VVALFNIVLIDLLLNCPGANLLRSGGYGYRRKLYSVGIESVLKRHLNEVATGTANINYPCTLRAALDGGHTFAEGQVLQIARLYIFLVQALCILLTGVLHHPFNGRQGMLKNRFASWTSKIVCGRL